MIGEILTGLFAGATFGYLYARKKHYDKASQDPVEPVEKVTFTAPVPKHEHYWWQEFGSSKYTNRQKLPETKEKLEVYLKNHMNQYPPAINGQDQLKSWSDWESEKKKGKEESNHVLDHYFFLKNKDKNTKT